MFKMAANLWSSVSGATVAAAPTHVDPVTNTNGNSVVGATSYVAASPTLTLGKSHLKLAATINAHDDRVWSVAWHPTEDLFATCSGDKTVKLWSLHGLEWRCIGELNGEHQRTIRSVEWSPDGKRLAAASFDATVTIWRKSSPQFAMELENVLDGHESEVKSVSWSRNGSTIASCARDKTVQLWEDTSATAPLHRSDSDNDYGDDEGEVDRQFDCVAILQGHTQDVKMVRFHPDLPNVLLSCGYDDVVKVWEESPTRKDDWHCTQTIKHHESTVWSIAFQPVTSAANTVAVPRLFASSSDDGSVALWRLVDDSADRPPGIKAVRWALAATSRGVHEGGAIYCVDWCPKVSPNCDGSLQVGSILASVGADESLIIYEVAASSQDSDDDGVDALPLTLKPIISQRSAHPAEVNCVRFSRHGNQFILATTSDDGTVKIWEVVP